MKNIYFTHLGQYKILQTNLFSFLILLISLNTNAQTTSGLTLFQIESAVDISYNINSSVTKKLHSILDTNRINTMDKISFNRSFDNGIFIQRYNNAGETEVLYTKQSSSNITPSNVKHQVIRGDRAYYYDGSLNLVEDVNISSVPLPNADVQSIINDYLQSEQERRNIFASRVSCMRSNGAIITYLPDKIFIIINENGRKHKCYFTYEGRPLERFTYQIEDDRILESEKYTYTVNSQNIIVPQMKIKMELKKLPDSNIPIEVYWQDIYSNYYITLFNNGNFISGRENNILDNNKDSFSLIPSVAKDYITIISNFEYYENCFAKIIDLNGKIILQKNITCNSQILELPNLNNGLYILQLENNGKKESKKFTILK